jgi:hypothetical protein
MADPAHRDDAAAARRPPLTPFAAHPPLAVVGFGKKKGPNSQ